MIKKQLHCYLQVPSTRNFDLDFNGKTFRVLKKVKENGQGYLREHKTNFK